MVAFISLVHLTIIFAVAWRCRKREAALRRFFWPAFMFRILAGVALGVVYLYYYSTADTFAYFGDASKLAALARSDLRAWLDVWFSGEAAQSLGLTFHQPRALFLTRITSIFSLLTADQYWIIGAYYSAFSFAGAWWLVKVIDRHIPGATFPAVVAFLFLPSVVFWTSGLLKESLAVAALYSLSALLLRVWFDERLRPGDLVVASLSAWLLWNLKYYYAAVFLPVVVAALLCRFVVRRRQFSAAGEAVLWLTLLILPAMAVTLLHPNFSPNRLFDVIVANNAAYNALSDEGGVVHFHDLRATFSSLLLNAPWALFSGLFRPLFWESSGLLPVLAGIENTIVLVLFVVALPGMRKYPTSPFRLLLLTALVYVAALCILLTFSAPNFGTLSRYRAGYFSFFVFIVLSGRTPPLWKGWRRLS